MNHVRLDYGRTGVEIELDQSIADWDIIEPRNNPPLDSFSDAFSASMAVPIGRPPLNEIISPSDDVVIVTADGTRPVPNKLIIPAIIKHCKLKPENVTVLIGTGSHRPHSRQELLELLGRDIVSECRVICHDASDTTSLKYIGSSSGGIPVYMNIHYLRASKKIVIGFIEPHFFAGFSGGAKGICPAICGLETIDAFHAYEIIGHVDSDYGKLDNNPQQAAARDVVQLAPPDFMVNVILNNSHEVTHLFAGDYIKAHRDGCLHARETAMVPLKQKYPIVITSNSGYPLDQNLYQTVKGISAASLITEDGGTIIIASECSRGIPDDGNFAGIMQMADSADSVLDKISRADYKMMDRWQAQKLAMVLRNKTVKVYSSLSREDVEKCKMIKVNDFQAEIIRCAASFEDRPRIAVMPRGPLTIPHLNE